MFEIYSRHTKYSPIPEVLTQTSTCGTVIHVYWHLKACKPARNIAVWQLETLMSLKGVIFLSILKVLPSNLHRKNRH